MTTKATQDKHWLVVGLGVTGLASARFLHERGARVRVADSRAEAPNMADVQALGVEDVHCGPFADSLLADIDEVLASPGVPLATPLLQAAIQQGIPVIGDIELFGRHVQSPVIAVTGSNGKSTVVTLLGEMAEEAGKSVQVAGNIGLPVLQLLTGEQPDLYVLELSSFQLETTATLSADAATVLNVSADHLDRYVGLDDYAAAKARIFTNAAVAVVNDDDDRVMAMDLGNARRVSFSCQENADWQLLDGVIHHHGEAVIKASELKMVGQHNVANAMAALAMGEAVGLPMPSMLHALREFKGLPHRVAHVRDHLGVRWLNDSKGTNVGATLAAVNGLDSNVILLAGGLAKGADFNELKTGLQKPLKALVLFGQDAMEIATAMQGVTAIYHVDDMQSAVKVAASHANEGDYVLLSPACASFDMFQGFEHRGQVFCDAVQALR